MSKFSDFLEDKILNITLKGATAYNCSTPYVELYTANPSDSGGGTVLADANYVIQAVTFGTVSGGAVSNSAAVTYPALNAGATITGMAIFDDASSTNMLYWAPLDASVTLSAGNIFSIAVGDLTVTLD
ncbi:MAG: hypothetical protein HN802_04805 [Candidatus Jacksonbacteria bacterium]|jgi:hypothetical protein|nr:hypothetical protein [Candidatus Jacksonbacteria bacterium]